MQSWKMSLTYINVKNKQEQQQQHTSVQVQSLETFKFTLRAQRPWGPVGTGSPGQPPRLSHSSWALTGTASIFLSNNRRLTLSREVASVRPKLQALVYDILPSTLRKVPESDARSVCQTVSHAGTSHTDSVRPCPMQERAIQTLSDRVPCRNEPYRLCQTVSHAGSSHTDSEHDRITACWQNTTGGSTLRARLQHWNLESFSPNTVQGKCEAQRRLGSRRNSKISPCTIK